MYKINSFLVQNNASEPNFKFRALKWGVPGFNFELWSPDGKGARTPPLANVENRVPSIGVLATWRKDTLVAVFEI